jgi:iron(III) transport system substrate-binding protein
MREQGSRGSGPVVGARPGSGTATTRGRRLVAAAGLAAAATLLAACGGGGGTTSHAIPKTWSGVQKQAKTEKTVLFYTVGDDIAAAMTKGFEKAYPWATVKSVVGSPGDLVSRALTEARAGSSTADVIMLPGGQRKTLVGSGVVQSYKVPNDGTMSKQFVDPTYYSHATYVTPINLVYNTNKLNASEVPTNIYDLANPRWKGKIAFDRPQNVGTAATFLAGPRKLWGDAKWKTWLKGLKANGVFLTADATSAYQAVLRGEAEIGVDNPGDVLSQPKGTPMANGFYDDVVPFVQYVWLTKHAAHPSAGALFVNWMMSPDGQKAFAATGRSPALQSLDVENSLGQLLPGSSSLEAPSDLAGFYDDPKSYLDAFDEYWPS